MGPLAKVEFQPDRSEGVPLYLQLKRYLEHLVRTGSLAPGDRLPTEREMARQLGLSRNTVSLAYRQLEAEGLITCRQGSGTYVARGEEAWRSGGRRERLARLIDVCLEEAVNLGFDLDEFLSLAQARARERKEHLRRVRIAFVECNREQVDYFARQIHREMHLGPGVAVVPVLLDEWRNQPEVMARDLAGVEMVVTTFFHLQEVRALLGDAGKQILAIGLDPDLTSIVRVARLPRGRKVGLVCISQAFADTVTRSLEAAGIDHIQLLTTTTRDPAELTAFLAGVGAVIVSPGRRREVERLLPRRIEVIEFVYRPDAGSLSLLRTALLEAGRSA